MVKIVNIYDGYDIVTPLEAIEATLWFWAVSAQQAELYTLIWACILAKGKITTI